jgi:hypothetical protein
LNQAGPVHLEQEQGLIGVLDGRDGDHHLSIDPGIESLLEKLYILRSNQPGLVDVSDGTGIENQVKVLTAQLTPTRALPLRALRNRSTQGVRNLHLHLSDSRVVEDLWFRLRRTAPEEQA